MLWLLALSLLGAATIGSVIAYQRGAAGRLEGGRSPALLGPGSGPNEERQLQTLRPGDVVVRGDEDWLIVGSASYREEDERWWMHVLEDGRSRSYLEVRKRPEWSATLLRSTDGIPEHGHLHRGLTFRQQSFSLFRRGDAYVRVDGEHDVEAGLCKYATYHGPGGAVLNVEERDGVRLAWAGEPLEPSSLMLMPGEAPRPESDAA